MNNWLQSKFFLRILALIIAIILWMSATEFSLPFLNEENITIKRDVPVNVRYDDTLYEEPEISQKKVDLHLWGDSLFYQYLANYRLYIDLDNKGPGIHRNVPIQIKGLPSTVKYDIRPRNLTVKLKEKGVSTNSH